MSVKPTAAKMQEVACFFNGLARSGVLAPSLPTPTLPRPTQTHKHTHTLNPPPDQKGLHQHCHLSGHEDLKAQSARFSWSNELVLFGVMPVDPTGLLHDTLHRPTLASKQLGVVISSTLTNVSARLSKPPSTLSSPTSKTCA